MQPLGLALTTVVIVGLCLACAVWIGTSWLLAGSWPWTVKSDANRLDVTKVALTIVGGAGAIVALVVAYRRQKDIEASRFTDQFGAAASQLGSLAAAERLAGVYAMASTADRHPFFAQQCVDVLCGYLRLPFDTDPDSAGLTAVTTKRVTKLHDEELTDERRHEHYSNDQEVRESILYVIADRLHSKSPSTWHSLDYNLKGAKLTVAPFRGLRFEGKVVFEGATFLSDAHFANSEFLGETQFGRANFYKMAIFDDVKSSKSIRFSEAIFHQTAKFERLTAKGVSIFEGTKFRGAVWLGKANFDGEIGFARARFDGGPANCQDAWFQGAFVKADGDLVESNQDRPLASVLVP